MIIHQALHGYDAGHCLLAASVSLETEEKLRLGPLSDLSGSLVDDGVPYLTVYPCGRFVVVARTWLDPLAGRRGAVLTHSLLVDKEDACALSRLESLVALHTRPDNASASEPFSQVLHIELNDADTTTTLSDEHCRLLVASWFATDLRPVFWRGTDSAQAALLWMWSRLLPSERSNWSACTRCYGPRFVGDSAMAWQVFPKEAQSYFYRAQEQGVVVDSDHPSDALTRWMAQSWVQHLASETATGHQVRLERMAELGQSESTGRERRLALRLLEPEFAHPNSTHAHLAKLDIIGQLQLPQPYVDAAVAELLASLGDVPLAERTLLLALEVLARQPHILSSVSTDSVGDWLELTVERALPESSPAELARLVQLVNASDGAGLQNPAWTGIEKALRNSSSKQVVAIVRSGGLDFGALLFDRIPGSAIAPALLDLLQDPSESFQDLAISLLAGPEARESLVAWPGGLSALVEANFDSQRLSKLWTAVGPALTNAQRVAVAAAMQFDETKPLHSIMRDGLAINLGPGEHGELPDDWAQSVLERQTHSNLGLLLKSPLQALVALHAHDQLKPDRAVVQLLTALKVEDLLPLSAIPPGALPKGVPWRHQWAKRMLEWLLPAAVGDKVSIVQVAAWLPLVSRTWGVPSRDASVLSAAKGAEFTRVLSLMTDEGCSRLLHPSIVRTCARKWALLSASALVDNSALLISLLASCKAYKAESHRVLSEMLLHRGLALRDPLLADLIVATFSTVHLSLCRNKAGPSIRRWVKSMIGGDWDKAKGLRQSLVGLASQPGWPSDFLVQVAAGDKVLLRDLRSLRYGNAKEKEEVKQGL